MKKSQVKNTANKTGKDTHLYQYRKHKNLVTNINKNEKKKSLFSLTIENESILGI